MSQAEHFARIAPRYDELRRLPQLAPIHELLVREGELAGRRVLDIGCGTGSTLVLLSSRFEVDGAGLDPSEEMLKVARAKVLPTQELKHGTAEELPFEDGRFDGALMQLVVHHVDRARAFPEARRVLVPGGRLLIVTPDPAAFPRFWMASLFPSYVAVEQRRFPTPDHLQEELRSAGFVSSRTIPLSIPRSFNRDYAIERLQGRYTSTFDHLSDEEYRAGLERAERELPDRIEYTLELAILVAERD